ncbi:serine protease inhibitor 2.1-like [Limulus polyphemus]|uniref:Serine protease inhibitor 2.1-like n=1 Tax=Limulus polyphemus TaxID=6850 RepID=A0ABM1SHR0_LIMPO|nr:serine protease inhibitor 2.1-like [Limulus polyphemus]XP_013775864.1 serine protease inhibitor 2.1-like [Limulus polyphemus]XP_022243165.1 serine protease inhibitor 2.1-like [Limulus polyphemus]
MMLLPLTAIFGFFAICGGVLFSGQVDVTDSAESKIVKANNQLALSVLKALDKKHNIVMSPWSLSMAFGMAYLGASGRTAHEMENVLGYGFVGIKGVSVHDLLRKEDNLLKSGSSDKNELSNANVVLIREGYTIFKSYKDNLKRFYNSSITEINFTRRQGVLQWVNAWGYRSSKGNIRKLLTEVPPETTKLMILNGVYFKGKWSNPFNPDFTYVGPFTNENGQKVFVPMMYTINEVLFTVDKKLGVYVVDLPYVGNDISMIIFLPTPNSNLEKVENALTLTTLDEILTQMGKETLQIILPKFELKDDRKLKETLKSLGMQTAFSDIEADFSGITGTRDLFVEEVVHKAVIRVDEEGTEAAANTVLTINSKRKPFEFLVNRPFLFLIRDNRRGVILFLGHVTELK